VSSWKLKFEVMMEKELLLNLRITLPKRILSLLQVKRPPFQTGLTSPQTGLTSPQTGLTSLQTGLTSLQTGLTSPQTGLKWGG
jgi:hypothetical protein